MTTLFHYSHIQKRIVVLVMAITMFFGMIVLTPKAEAQTSNREAMMAQIQQLLQIVLLLQAQVAALDSASGGNTSVEGGFTNRDISLRDRVQTTDILRVRAAASASASLINNVAAFSQGTVVDGPQYADGYTWWHVTYDNGTSGWSAENWLNKVSDGSPSSASRFITVNQTDPRNDGPAKITLTAPRDGAALLWSGGKKTFNISWKAENIPENAVIVWETKATRLFSGYVGGGSGFDVIPSGDSTGTRVSTYGPSYSDPGEYQVRVVVRECHSQGCRVSPTFPGQEEDVEIYATSRWHDYTIGDLDEEIYESEDGVEIYNIRVSPNPSQLGERMRITWTLDGIDSGDYLTCVSLEARDGSGGGFSPTTGTSESPCEEARDGTNSHTWVPVSQSGFRFDPGKYRVKVRVLDEDTGSGKDRGTLAIRTGDWFTVEAADDNYDDELQDLIEDLLEQTEGNTGQDEPNIDSDIDAAVQSWSERSFTIGGTKSSLCTGTKYVGYSEKYDAWVGAQLCGSNDQYKLYMSSSKTGTYYQIADYGGHGQDHCELVNPNFTISNGDNINSGSCSDCAVGSLTDPNGETVFARSSFGEAFEKVTSRDWGDLSTEYYQCSVDIGSLDGGRAETSFWDLDDNDFVYVVGAYEGSYPSGDRHSFGYHPQGEVTLNMTKQAGQSLDTMLVLTSYEPVLWKLEGDAAEYVTRVFLSGYYDQEITGIDNDVEVIHMSHQSGDSEYFYAYDRNSSNFTRLQDYIEDKSGVEVYLYWKSAYSLDTVNLGQKG